MSKDSFTPRQSERESDSAKMYVRFNQFKDAFNIFAFAPCERGLKVPLY